MPYALEENNRSQFWKSSDSGAKSKQNKTKIENSWRKEGWGRQGLYVKRVH